MKGAFWMTAALCAVLLASCSDEEEILSRQQESIVSYLTSSHVPALLSEQDAAESLDENPPYFTTLGNTIYRYVEDVYNPDRLLRPEVGRGDRVTLTFAAYVFGGSTPSLAQLYYTNDAELVGQLENEGLNPAFWVGADGIPAPLEVRIGDGSLLGSIEEALVGCREGDAVEVYLTYNMAYGDKIVVGVVPKQSPIAFFCTIDQVKR